MKAPPKPSNETKRLETLHALEILDTPPEERFDRHTRLAKRLFGVDIALISLIDADRQWFKSKQGLDADETSRDISFCGHAILDDEVLVVPDAEKDARFADNPLVAGGPEIRFYAGYPLSAPDGSKLGTLCLIDGQPRTLSDEELALLRDLGAMVEAEPVAAQLATIDDLTRLTNRRGLLHGGEYALAMCRRFNHPATLLFIDIDAFKAINDEHGHAEGDHALTEFSKILLGAFRSSDLVARLSGDEFCVLLTHAAEADVDTAETRFLAALCAWSESANRDYTLKCSVGRVAFDPGKHESFADLLAEADQRMYERKRSKNQPPE
ncbi:MAG: sensor domain-containing diguanylate cyclase [Verrucomicrobia bacterium]|nr:sensor domain-containing diguanylate cyclase [Verrucomicrobiota bacterium]MDA1086685.1 sensor domain-containing diguanylate cyclase [Verrucomicrobiota bacterium]